MTDNYVNVRRVLNEAQKQRLQNHKPSVVELDGKLITTLETINIAGKGQKTNKLISALPAEEEQAVPFTSAEFLFRDLIQVNAMLTNACNLACSLPLLRHYLNLF